MSYGRKSLDQGPRRVREGKPPRPGGPGTGGLSTPGSRGLRQGGNKKGTVLMEMLLIEKQIDRILVGVKYKAAQDSNELTKKLAKILKPVTGEKWP